VRLALLALALAVSLPVCAQEESKKKQAKGKKPAAAHKKASTEQIRKFNEMQKKQQK
jgi:hypothetical protein